jgi:hypothetical protein
MRAPTAYALGMRLTLSLMLVLVILRLTGAFSKLGLIAEAASAVRELPSILQKAGQR